MAKPKKFGEMQSLTNSTQKEYFSSKYSLRAKAGGGNGLEVGQDIYCLPLVKDGIYEFHVHNVKPRGERGFKSKYLTAIMCHGHDEVTGEKIEGATCCQLAQQEWDRYVANGKQGETLISFGTTKVYLPVLVLGNDTGVKSAKHIPVSKLTMAGRDYSYIDFSGQGFNTLLDMLKNDLVNNGLIDYELTGPELYNTLMDYMSKYILKVSIVSPPQGQKGKYRRNYSFVPFTNQNIGAETGSYKNITEGLAKAPKLIAEANEYLTLFGNEIDSVITPWTDIELANYINGVSEQTSANMASQLANSGIVPTAPKTVIPKEEQVVIEDVTTEEISIDDNTSSVMDDDLGGFFEDSSVDDISLEDETPTSAPAEKQLVAAGSIDIDDDMSFDIGGEEDFFGE